MQVNFSDRDADARDDGAACREMLRAGSRTFLAASLALPRAVSNPACALYAFCRIADDEFDLNGGGADTLARLRDRLDRIYDRRPLPIPADRAFAEVAWRFAIPRALPDALLEGFAWDAEGRRYASLADLNAYAVRVAGTVGAMMAMLMGQRAPDVVARACELGVAMQLTNIARDVGEDARAGRLYLPLDWLREAGVDPDAFLARPVFSEALASVIRRLLRVADLHYASSEGGIARLPAACSAGIMAARILYAEIGRDVERCGCDSVSRRAVVTPLRKALLIGNVIAAVVAPASASASMPLPEASFLIDAVTAAPSPETRPRDHARDDKKVWDLGRRFVWLINLFERLERREQAWRS
jgi:15-cis-phytoene synthase